MFDEYFIRAWRLYLSGCVANFSIGDLQLFQVVFSRPANNLIPLTRSHLIADTCAH
jgi:cyclopropane-fatty-acyl-phospholipid synthase